MPEYILIEDNLEVYKQELNEEEIPDMLSSGFVVAVLRLNTGKIEYASLDENNNVSWKEPITKWN